MFHLLDSVDFEQLSAVNRKCFQNDNVHLPHLSNSVISCSQRKSMFNVVSV